MKKSLVLLAVAGLTVLLSASSCNFPSACERLQPPTPADLAAVNQQPPREVEIEIEGVECDLSFTPEGQAIWKKETDTTTSRPRTTTAPRVN